jgi:hypothetical protein
VTPLTRAAAAASAGRRSFKRRLIDMTAGGRCNLGLATRRGGRGRSRVFPKLHSLRDNCFFTCSRNKKNVVDICHWQPQENIIQRAPQKKNKTESILGMIATCRIALQLWSTSSRKAGSRSHRRTSNPERPCTPRCTGQPARKLGPCCPGTSYRSSTRPSFRRQPSCIPGPGR